MMELFVNFNELDLSYRCCRRVRIALTLEPFVKCAG
jgi:hypothetical protein